MFSRFFSRIAGRGRESFASTPLRRRRPVRRIAAAAGQAIQSLESRVMLSTLYVDASAPGPTYNGTSWTTAYKDLQLALSASTSSDEIRIADGTYKPTSTTSRTINFALRNGVAIRGGYAGYGASDPNSRNIALYPTILSGDIGTSGYSGDNSFHVLTATGAGSATVLDGVTVTGGNASGSSGNRLGGGLYATDSSITLSNCTFSTNSATYGGGVYNYRSSPTLSNCTFSGNGASYGGGMYNTSASPTLSNCTFSSNTGSYGGGIYNDNSSSVGLTNCIFRSNWASEGGGMCNASGSWSNLTNCTFSGNSASSGGGMYNSSSSPRLTNCTFNGNSVQAYGGGMYNSSSSPMLTNCTFSGNLVIGPHDYGGGMYNSSSSPRLTNCIVWGNANTGIYNFSGTPVIAYSVIQGGYEGTGNIDADPLFVRSPWAGPDGVFNTADDDLGDVRLRPGSPALDVGSNAAVSGVSTDLAGNARVQNGTVDMGAHEGPTAAPAAKILYVDSAAGGANTGVSWTHAFTNLRSALQAASDGDAIRIADGTYMPTSTTNRSISFALRNGVAIYGGYAGHGAADPNARDTVAYPTILSGDVGTAGSSADNSYHVLTAIGVGPLTIVDGVTVTGGNANGSGSSQSYGGGLFASAASSKLTNCIFSANSASYGGGMYNYSSSPTLANCTFSGNSARSGGGMHNYSSSPMLTNCTFNSNSASNSGGGVSSISSSPILSNCTFTGNSATSTYGTGGGMHNYSSSPMLANCNFIANTASYGGGIYNYSTSSPTLTNCIVWGNANGAIYNGSSTPVVTYSDIEGGYTGVGNINVDPLFVRNPSPGPDGQWNGINDDYGDLRLQPGSPCIDRGNNVATGLAGITTDLAGKPRFVDIALTPDAGAGTPPIVDMGAYEAQWACPPWLDPAGLAVWDAGDYSLDIGGGVLTVAADDGNRSERLAGIRQAIALGRSTGAGIVSSAATEDRGVIAALDGEGNILMRVALLGDVTLDERIDGDDYFAMDLAFLAGSGLRPEADVNVDGAVDGRDYLMLDLGFLRSAGGGVQQAAQQPAAGVFSTRSIAEELLIEEEAVLG